MPGGLKGADGRPDDLDPARISLLEVLDRPLTFSQQHLLDAKELERAAHDRGLSPLDRDLERLHQHRLLVPAFVIARPRWDIARRVAASSFEEYVHARLWGLPKTGDGLREARAEARVRDAWGVRFRPWAGEIVPTPHGPVHRREYLYSTYQLFDLESVLRLVPMLRRPRGTWTKWDRMEYGHARRNAVVRRDRVAILEALEPFYRPGIVALYRFSSIGAEDEYARYQAAFQPPELLDASGWSSDELYATATDLIHRAQAVDPLRGWLDLVRHVHPDRWPRLRDGALRAIEFRAAAEMLFRFLEDLQREGRADPFPAVPRLASHALNMRVRRDRSELDPVLMDFGLSPHPAMVLALEGPTEMAIVPRAMDVLGIPRFPSYITLVDSGSENARHGLLAQYLSGPRLGEREGDAALFERPPTRYLIVVDGDRDFRDPDKREQGRKHWVWLLYNSLPEDFRSPESLAEIDQLVLVEVWNDGDDFERAHFTDREIASALLATGHAPPGMTMSRLTADLRRNRGERRPLKEVWKTWHGKPRKPDLAVLLWPFLEERLRAAEADEARLAEIPIARVLLQADALAARTPRRHVLFKLGKRVPSPADELDQDVRPDALV